MCTIVATPKNGEQLERGGASKCAMLLLGLERNNFELKIYGDFQWHHVAKKLKSESTLYLSLKSWDAQNLHAMRKKRTEKENNSSKMSIMQLESSTPLMQPYKTWKNVMLPLETWRFEEWALSLLVEFFSFGMNPKVQHESLDPYLRASVPPS